MPTYEYACTKCHRRVEAVQRFSDPPLTTCEECGGDLKRVFHPVGIVLKGSGFYATDSRSNKALSPTKKDGSSGDSGSSGGTGSSGDGGGSDTKASKPKDSTGKTGSSKKNDAAAS